MNKIITITICLLISSTTFASFDKFGGQQMLKQNIVQQPVQSSGQNCQERIKHYQDKVTRHESSGNNELLVHYRERLKFWTDICN